MIGFMGLLRGQGPSCNKSGGGRGLVVVFCKHLDYSGRYRGIFRIMFIGGKGLFEIRTKAGFFLDKSHEWGVL
jgi:hypothetical protein